MMSFKMGGAANESSAIPPATIIAPAARSAATVLLSDIKCRSVILADAKNANPPSRGMGEVFIFRFPSGISKAPILSHKGTVSGVKRYERSADMSADITKLIPIIKTKAALNAKKHGQLYLLNG